MKRIGQVEKLREEMARMADLASVRTEILADLQGRVDSARKILEGMDGNANESPRELVRAALDALTRDGRKIRQGKP